MPVAFLSIMSDGPNLLTISPTRRATDHDVLLDKAGDYLAAARQAPHFVVCELVPSMNDQKPTAGQLASAKWSLAIFVADVLETEILQDRLWCFGPNCKPRK